MRRRGRCRGVKSGGAFATHNRAIELCNGRVRRCALCRANISTARGWIFAAVAIARDIREGGVSSGGRGRGRCCGRAFAGGAATWNAEVVVLATLADAFALIVVRANGIGAGLARAAVLPRRCAQCADALHELVAAA